MKKALSKILILSMLTAFIPNGLNAKAELNLNITEVSETTAAAEFGAEMRLKNITKADVSGLTSFETACGENVVKIKKHKKHPSYASENGRIRVDIDDSFFCGNTDGTQFVLTVYYADELNINSADKSALNLTDSAAANLKGFFNIKYDGFKGETSTETVYLGMSGKLKSKRFVLSDANFANGINGYDLEIGFPNYEAARGASAALISGIKIEKYVAENPVMVDITSDEAGNVFNPQTGVLFRHEYKNYSATEQKVTVSYTAKNKLGNIEWQGSENYTFAPNEVKKIDVKPQIKTFGLYYYTVNISGLGVDFEKTVPFSYINTNPDGIINEKMGYCTHLNTGYTDEELDQVLELVKKSNANLVRNDFTWSYTENPKKSYHYGYYDPVIRKLQEQNMRALLVAAYGNTLYTNTERSLPQNDDAIKGYADWVSSIIDYYDMDLNDFMFELWNEPNLIGFADTANSADGGAAVYANFAAGAAKILKEKYPDIQLGALALAGVTMPNSSHHTQDFLEKAADAGVFDNVDALTMHPYATNGSAERSGMLEKLREDIQLLSDKGYPNVKLWNSEVGWSTALQTYKMFTERQQSAYHQRYFVLMDAIEANEYYWIYDFIDDGNLKTEYEDNFGIIENVHYPKSGVALQASESYVALTNMNNILAGCDKPVKVQTSVDNVYAYTHRDNKRNRDVLTFWRENENTNAVLSINLGVNSATFVDSYGNETVLESDDGVYELVPDFELSYLIGNFNNVSIRESAMEVSEIDLDVLSDGVAEVKINGITDASKAVVKESGFVVLQNGSIKNGSANLKFVLPELTESKTSFNILLKDGNKTKSIIRIYLNKRETLGANFFDDFSNYGYSLDTNENNRKDRWWIESQGNEDVDDYICVKSITDSKGKTMEDALAILPTNDATTLKARCIRGGRGWNGNVGAGESMTVEFDIYAEDDTVFTLGAVSSDKGDVEEFIQAYLFHIDTRDTSKVYCHADQSTNRNPTKEFSGVTFKRGEVNNVKVKYIFNTDVSDNTKDTIQLEITNSAGTTTGTVTVNYRYTAYNNPDTAPKPVVGIKGVSFFKWDTTSNVYIDNVRVSSDVMSKETYSYFEDDFSTLLNGSNDSGNNRVDTWRIEGGSSSSLNGWNTDLSSEYVGLGDKGTMTSALKLANPTDAIIRGGRGWNGSVGAGETLTVEFDIYAEQKTKFAIGAVSEQNGYQAEENTQAYFFYLKPKSGLEFLSNKSNFYYHTDQSTTENPTQTYPNIKFMCGEVNHIRIDYTLNDDVSTNNGDTMTLTVTNSEHTGSASATVYPKYRYTAYTQQNPPKTLTGICGISFFKWDDDSTMYLDNIKVYKDNAVYPGATIETSDNEIKINFSKKMSSFGLKKDGNERITVKCGDNAVSVAGSLDETGKIYTLTANNGFKGGSEYTVTVPTSVTDNAALPLEKSVTAKFIPTAAESSISLEQNGVEITADKIVSGKDVAVKATASGDIIGRNVLICIAGYDEDNHLVDAKFKRVKATKKTMEFVTSISEASSYKVFLWNAAEMQPVCNNL